MKLLPLIAMAYSLLAGLADDCNAEGKPKPNFLVLCSDQQHWQAVGAIDPFFDTPAQDELSGQSIVFQRSFCATPQCSPSRSSLLTGFYPHRTGVMGNVGASGGNSLKQPTIGALLQAAGYKTAYFGKWHLGDDPAGNAGWNEAVKRGPDAKTTERGLDFLSRCASRKDGRPFALFLMYLDPHNIYHFKPGQRPSPKSTAPLSRSWYQESFDGKPAIHQLFMTANQGLIIWNQPQPVWQAYRDFYRQKVKLYDDQVAKIISAIRRLGFWENTVIVNTSDHGDMDTNHRLIFKGPFMYEHMVRVPTMIRVPGALGGVEPCVVQDYDWVNVDLVPTLMELAGLQPAACDGQSAAPILTGRGRVPSRPFVIGQYYGKQAWVNPIRMIRTEQYKLNVYIKQGEELYDLKSDPEELRNLADDPAYQDVKRRLRAELDRWIQDHNDPFYSQQPTPLNPREWKSIGRARAGQPRRLPVVLEEPRS